MTNLEFAEFTDKLFVAFPSLYEWLKGTYKPEETQRLWRATLAAYTLKECMSVITRWTSGVLNPFEAYERDKVHLIIRSICELDRDRKHKRDSQDEMNGSFYDKSKRGFGVNAIGCGTLLDSTMAVAVRAGAAEYLKFKLGEIDWPEYVSRREVIMREHGF